ncbi:inositol polyphosphate 5-phosphatase K-like isoform X2 [Galleria mellonella]|uniref:Inositol polyphosphate 5-phosphatase K-like isoform X2 n=1 Tax=Galleria mellonella TaxID=7137 RepID=A0A6J1WZ33_GALME|nr:inositol polyphosphate 5-phosphatase K-like isoform X2 [Galleria mellonella]
MDTLRFYFVTWNVATRNPGQDLNALLDFPSQFNKSKPLPDFYIIGLQEVKSQPQNMVMDALFSDPWSSTFNRILCRQGFVIAKSTRLQGMLLLVYTQLKHVTHLRDIEAQYTKTGLGGMWGNKGAVSVRFNIYGCSVCLVNCHLTAHEHLLADRINDYNTIIKQHIYHVSETTNILYHDYVFWIGDLNFRTDHPAGNSPSSEDIVALLKKVEKDKYTSLLKHDQLLAVKDAGDAFSEFTEPEIQFPPTYKFTIGSDEYDLKRKPSWTDRILYKVIANNYENITLRADLISYNHIPHYTVSDHKPVVAQFNIKAFSNYTEKTVEFAPISRIWYIGDADFRTQCTLSHDVEINPNDWIGIYDADFQSLDDYKVYEYLAKVSLPQGPITAGQPRTITLSFPVGSGVRTPGFYRFIYFSQPNNDVRSVLGVSEPFEVSSKEDRLVTIDPCEPSSSSSSPGRPAANTSTADIFTDFTGLDVAKLSRHFANDLSID